MADVVPSQRWLHPTFLQVLVVRKGLQIVMKLFWPAQFTFLIQLKQLLPRFNRLHFFVQVEDDASSARSRQDG